MTHEAFHNECVALRKRGFTISEIMAATDGVLGFNQISKLYEYIAFNADDVLVIPETGK